MAIRYREGRDKPYCVYWKNPFTGKQSSKYFEGKKEAEQFNALTLYRLQYERDYFREQIDEPEPEVTQTLESVFYLYLKERNFSKICLRNTLLLTKVLMEKFGEIEIDAVDTNMLVNMLKICSQSGSKSATIQRKMGIIKAVLNWAHRQGYIESMPRFPVMPKGTSEVIVPPTQEEAQKIFNVAKPHLKRAVFLSFVFGMRVGPSELLKLTWEDVDLQNKVIRVPNAHKGVKNPWREVPIPESKIQLLKAWQEEDIKCGIEYLVSYRGKPIGSFKQAWATALKEAGITRHIRPYDLRHAFATESIANGVDYGTVAAIMGHSNPSMVMNVYQFSRDAQRQKAMDIIGAVFDVAPSEAGMS